MKLLKKIRSFLRPQKPNEIHPWFYGFNSDKFSEETSLSLLTEQEANSPVLFIARGHSGTAALSRILEYAGVYMGNFTDFHCLNSTYDSLYFAYGFQRSLLPKFFKWGQGCTVDSKEISLIADECLKRHLRHYKSGRWGFKTCLGAFSHQLYKYIFPQAKYIYLIRDGRDTILSGNGYFYLTNPSSREAHWDYFKAITFGINNDIDNCPFKFPKRPSPGDSLMQNRFWVQAKSWSEHVCMVEYLNETSQLSENVYTLKYEELCLEPEAVLKDLFCFLDVDLTKKTLDFSRKFFHTGSIGRWKDYINHIDNITENMGLVFDSMTPELKKTGYL